LGITDLNSSNVLNSVKNIKEGSYTDWRLPTKAELLELQETPVTPATQSETGLVQKTCCAWVTEPNSENIEWKFYVDDGNDVWASSKVPPDDRIVVVRNYTPAAPSSQTPVAATPASGTAAPSANLAAEKKPATEPAAPSVENKDIPAVKGEGGALRASRRACLAKKAQAAKSPATAVSPIAAPAIAAPPAKQSPSAKVKTPAPQPDNTIGDSITIQFAMNKSIISPEELSKLKAFYAKIKGKKGRIVIEGNSDSDGDAADNFKVSGDRALSVKAMLHKLGLNKKVDVKIIGLSDTKPVAENTTEAGRKLNRRAEITFIAE
jgi:outer membrane protein OmpA-like peptidoglycan-associated protein